MEQSISVYDTLSDMPQVNSYHNLSTSMALRARGVGGGKMVESGEMMAMAMMVMMMMSREEKIRNIGFSCLHFSKDTQK